MLTNKKWRGVVAALIAMFVAVAALAGCSNNAALPDLSGDKAASVRCEIVVAVANTVNDLANNAKDDPEKLRTLRRAGIDPFDNERVVEVKNLLLKRSLECMSKQTNTPSSTPTSSATQSSSASPTPTPTPSIAEEKAEVKDKGKTSMVPVVKTAPSTESVDTTADPLTPPSLPAELCPTLVDWSTLVKCVDDNDLESFVDAVNSRKASIGFGWSDIQAWANAKNVRTVEVRAIEVFGTGISDTEARSRAAKLIGGNDAQKLEIVRQPACFMNTRMQEGHMTDFVYCPPASRQVRVTLMPAVLKDGAITSIIDQSAGVFVDCDNIWWVPERISVPGRPPQVEQTPSAPPKATPTPTKPAVVRTNPPKSTSKAKNPAEAYVPSGDSEARGEDKTTTEPQADQPAVARPSSTATYQAPAQLAPVASTTKPRASSPPPVEQSAPATVVPSPPVDDCSVNPDFCG